MEIDIEQLKILLEHAKRNGRWEQGMSLALDFTIHLHTVLVRRTALLREASGWLGPHEHNPVELSKRIGEELKENP